MEEKTYNYLIGLGTGILATLIVSTSDDIRKAERLIPQEIYEIKDLNKDGRNDLISESSNGYKTPLFAHVKKDGNIIYLSGDQMKKLDPTTDYKTIEDMLNKK